MNYKIKWVKLCILRKIVEYINLDNLNNFFNLLSKLSIMMNKLSNLKYKKLK